MHESDEYGMSSLARSTSRRRFYYFFCYIEGTELMKNNTQHKYRRSIILLLVIILSSSLFTFYFSVSNTIIDLSAFDIYGDLDDQGGSAKNVNTEVTHPSDNSSTQLHAKEIEDNNNNDEVDDDEVDDDKVDDDYFDDDDAAAAIHEEKEAGTNVTSKENLVEEKLKTDTKDIQTESDKLNILLLYPDDWRWNSIGRENSMIQTPFLDSLGDEGMRFRKNCVTSSVCWLSRGMLFDNFISNSITYSKKSLITLYLQQRYSAAITHLVTNLGNLNVLILQNGIDGTDLTLNSCKIMDITWGMLANGSTSVIINIDSTGAVGMKVNIGTPCMGRSLSRLMIVHVMMPSHS